MKKYLAAMLCLSVAAVSLILPGCRSKKTDALPTDGDALSDQARTAGTEAAGSGSAAGTEKEETEKHTGKEKTTASATDKKSVETEASSETDGRGDGETDPETEAPETEAPKGDALAGVSSKGYLIEVRGGVTYVNGVLIANKTYALPASYGPGGLTDETEAAFDEMQEAAADDGIDLYVVSGFRSYSLQESLYNRYVSEDGKAAADRYSARPGHSEHQTGLAMDLNDVSYSFADTAAGRWVAANCWRYGFILRYPENKESETGYRYEPWHVRYLGKELAADVYQSGLSLEEYLGITSEYQS